ncbi:hypothetical protein AAVH_31140 [Aphelenchoides avenae]|nr:hypothetical protein AAVH_31140 [Aphelenchus avenae]
MRSRFAPFSASTCGRKGTLMEYKETSTRDGDFAEAVRRLQHCCIKTFWVDICDSPFLQSWMAQEADDFTVVSIDFDPPNATTDNGVLDAIMNRVRPRTIDVSEEYGPPFWDAAAAYTSKYLRLLARGSFLNSLQIAPVNLWRDAFPQPSFILDEPGYANYELRCYHTNVADGIDAFIESFVRDGCANGKLESVCISWTVRPHRPWPFGPSPMPKLLNSPRKTDKPLPEAAMLSWIRDAHRVSECQMHSFVNETQWKRMEVCKWSVGHDRTNDSRPWTMHVLQCLVKNF